MVRENGLKYAGIGSRETPKEVLEAMIHLASFLATKGCILRSGGADGADLAFEKGADLVNGNKEIYLPWRNFNNSTSKLIVKNSAFDIAERHHPYFNMLSQGAKRLQARNSHQVLGYNLDDPVDFIVCFTPKGSGSGGTGQAIRIAKSYKIPVFDFGKYKDINEGKEAFNEFYVNIIK